MIRNFVPQFNSCKVSLLYEHIQFSLVAIFKYAIINEHGFSIVAMQQLKPDRYYRQTKGAAKT
jgi:hypothetical protein